MVPAPPRFVGSETCTRCHADEAARWRESHHAQAMRPAADTSVLGDFADSVFTQFGVDSTFLRHDGGRRVRTAGPDGQPRDYEVAFSFGVDPLQQVLLALERGRLQAFTVAWDARPAAVGGQRWFSLHPDEPIPPGDPLHWTGLAQNWNAMCAECHSTDLRKGYRLEEDRYETTFAEANVACEACHGPGSAHAAWAEAASPDASPAGDALGLVVPFANDGASWTLAPGERIARRSRPRTGAAELDACGRCHARRAPIAEPHPYGRPLLDTHRPALLEEGLYHVDGQIRDEVYEWGSFLQSRMHAQGVTCSDCHEPHAARLRAEANGVCAQCHRPEVFDAPSHHHHAPGGEAARCVSCHMPTKLYMVVDARHDHSLRVPRPDLSAELGTPNACNACHAERSAAWAADAVARWYGPGRRAEPHFGEALHAGRTGAVDAERRLAALAGDAAQPAVARATALQELDAWLGPSSAPVVGRAIADPDPLLRFGAVGAARAAEPAARLALLEPLLRDPVRAVRIEAARALVGVPPALWRPGARNALADSLAEWRAAQQASADRPEAHVSLGALHAELGELAAARREYEIALRLGPWFVPAYLNLADLLREEGRDDEGEPLLRRALEIAPESADAHHALGLLLARTNRLDAAVVELGRAAELAPANARYAYALAAALQAAGESARAIAGLEAAHRRRPGERELLAGLATLSREAGRPDDARRFARELAALAPEDPAARALLHELEGGAAP